MAPPTTPTDSKLFFTKDDATDPRFGEFVKNIKTPEQISILSYPDDQGVINNGGRPGAKDGPDRVKKFFYKMTPPLKSQNELSFYDYGNLVITKNVLENHQQAFKLCSNSLKDSVKTISLGGGHDYGYPDAKAFLQHFKNCKTKPVIINFDAHLDVREVTENISSGTPFYRTLEDNYDFHFFQIGIQNFCNSKKHFNYCLEKGVKVITQDEISMSNKGLCDYLWPQLEHLQGSPLFISIDIDGFSSSFAPGCSQSWPTGITPHEFLTLFTRLNKNFKTKLLGIYEVAPNLDNNDITSKLAAQIMYSFVSSN